MSAPTRGARWAADVRDNYALQPDSDAMVTEVARLIDRADRLDAAIEELDSLVIESRQGPRVHPAVIEHRQLTSTLQRALASLGFEAEG